MSRILILLLLSSSSILFSKEWIILELDTAKQAVAILEKQNEALIWCDCCEDRTKHYIQIEKVYLQPLLDTPDKYTITLLDRNKDLYEKIDLAKLFINYKSKAVNLANFIKLPSVSLCKYGEDFLITTKEPITNEVKLNIHDGEDIGKVDDKIEDVDLYDYYKSNSRFLSNEIYLITYDGTKYISTRPIEFNDDETLYIAKDVDGSGIFLLNKNYTPSFGNDRILYDEMFLILENGEEIELNDLNIRGNSYSKTFKIFFLDKKQIEKLKYNKILKIKYNSTPKSHIELKEHISQINSNLNTIHEINYIF